MDEIKVPIGLRGQGRKLWDAVVSGYDLRADELTMLASACHTLSELVLIEKALRGAPALVPGSRGQLRPHPLLAEARQHRLALAKLLAGLGFTDVADDHGTARSDRGRKLALLRWTS